MKTIVLSPAAARALDGLRGEARTALEAALSGYAIEGTGDTRRLVGTSTVRLRVGDYRVIFDETANTLFVVAVGHRRDIYR